MKFDTIETGGVTVLEVYGDIVGGPDAAKFNDKLHSLVTEGKMKVIVDMLDVKFINSSGIGILIRGYTTVKNGGGELKLANLSEKIKGVLFLTKLNSVFDIYPTVKDAVESFE